MDTKKKTGEELITEMYDSKLSGQKAQLTQNYNQALSDLDASREAQRRQTEEALTATAVESARAGRNYNEVQNANGLTSGAAAQARLARDNQLAADLTTLRAAQGTAEAGIEEQKLLLGRQYQSAIEQARAENDLAKGQALLQEAKEADAQLLAKQEAAAQLMANAGDYTLLGQLYGLTDEQIAKLTPKPKVYAKSSDEAADPAVNLSAGRKAEIAQLVKTKLTHAQGTGNTQPIGMVLGSLINDSAQFNSDEELEYAKWVLNYMTN